MIVELLQIVWFFWPAAMANMAPVFANNIRSLAWLNIPLDGGKYFRGKRIFGDHKTVRGLLAGWVLASVTIMLQYWLFKNFTSVRNFTLYDYDQLNLFLLSISLGIGALVGDAIKSFFKRRAHIAPGQNWFPFDQIDFAIGSLFLAQWLVDISWRTVILGILLALIFHPIGNIIGWTLRLKANPL